MVIVFWEYDKLENLACATSQVAALAPVFSHAVMILPHTHCVPEYFTTDCLYYLLSLPHTRQRGTGIPHNLFGVCVRKNTSHGRGRKEK